jgi:hypothetical protein
MRKYRIEAQIVLVTGVPVVEQLEDAHLTRGIDPEQFVTQYALTGKDRLRGLGYTDREVATARFTLHPLKRELIWAGVRTAAL